MKTFIATIKFENEKFGTAVDMFYAADEDQVIHKAYAAYGYYGDFEIEIEESDPFDASKSLLNI